MKNRTKAIEGLLAKLFTVLIWQDRRQEFIPSSKEIEHGGRVTMLYKVCLEMVLEDSDIQFHHWPVFLRAR